MFSMCLFFNIGMRYSGHLPSVDDASVVVLPLCTTHLSMMSTTLTWDLRNT